MVKRFLFNLAAVASLFLFVSLTILTVRSLLLGRNDTLSRFSPPVLSYVESVDGKVLLSYSRSIPRPGPPPRGGWDLESVRARNYRPSDPPWFHVAGLSFCHAPLTAGRSTSRTYL